MFRIVLAIILLFSFSGCSEYFQNPLEDKETGEEINILLVDFNFFKTRMSFKFKDATTGLIINSNGTVTFSGKNGNDIVSFSGYKNEEYDVSAGQLELTVDPTIDFSESSPIEFSVIANIEGYNRLTKGIQIKSEGKKSYELFLSKIENEEENDLSGDIDFSDNDTVFNFSVPQTGFKSAVVENKPYEINYSINITDLKKLTDQNNNVLFRTSQEVINAYNSDPDNFIKITISTFSGYQPEIDVLKLNETVRNVLFHKLETGKFKKLVIANTEVANLNGGVISSTCKYVGDFSPDIFGFVQFENEYWNLLGEKVAYKSLNFSYTLASASEKILCDRGSSITFASSVTSSFSFEADVYDMENNFITSLVFKGKFPETFNVENVPAIPVKIVFRNNNPSFKNIPPLEISDFCKGEYEVNILPAPEYVEYQITLTAMCENNSSVGIAPTYSVDIKLKESDDPWQGANMEGGVANVMGIPNRDYEIRLLWENEWEYAIYSTKFDESGNYLGSPQENAKIKSKILEDGRIQISIEKIFDQDICNELGW